MARPWLLLFFSAALMGGLLLALGGVARAQEPSSAAGDPGALTLNEFMADNETKWIDPDDPGLDEYPDWFELYNPGGQPVSLDGLYLSDDPALPTKFAITDGLSIPAGGYVVFYADKEEDKEGPFHVNFRLSKETGFIGLFSGAQGQTEIDSVTYQQQETDVSVGRLPDGTGEWRRLNRPSPGHTNDVTSPLISNLSREPELPATNQPVTVRATITDDVAVASATLIYTATSGSTEVAMTSVGQDVYEAQIPGFPATTLVGYTVRAKDGDGQVTPDRSFELPLIGRYVVGYDIPPLVVNEVIADNYLGLEDPDDPGDYPDWFEIYNTSNKTVSLDGLYLTDRLDEPTTFAITDGLTIPAHGYVIFYADSDPEQSPYHTNFKLNRNKEAIGLYGAQGTVLIDSVSWGHAGDPVGALLTNVSYGRYEDGGDWQYLYCATPGEANRLCNNLIFVPLAAR
jgi:hypothetical protein